MIGLGTQHTCPLPFRYLWAKRFFALLWLSGWTEDERATLHFLEASVFPDRPIVLRNDPLVCSTLSLDGLESSQL